ncbi:MAG: hypothetical protein H7645_05705 [Candidatus Heimdallarchaeota archaeon]|nr:hypothetical protein [Candidatus Heimdallarchaeota archaeon]MCK4769818.1 hypothetical protein [Candidatus Heimdallarchaeota archaeon]
MIKKEIVCGVIIALLFSTALVQACNINQAESFFTLTILVTPGDAFDYGMYIANYLREINIDSRIKVFDYDCNIPNTYPKINRDWDLAICSFSGGGISPDLRALYTEIGSLNIFNLKSDIPYQNESEQMQNDAVTTFDLDERQQLYYDWQQLMMKNIVPILPLFSPRIYSAIWSNALGFDMRWGLSDSSPYMAFSGLHEGQESVDEFNVAHNEFESETSNCIDDYFNLLQWDLITEPLIQWSPDNAPLTTGIISNWEETEESNYKFYLRDNVYWNPSFYVTDRNASSAPLLTESSPGVWEVTDAGILIPGLKSGEVSDGSNQQITAKDAVFTLLTAANPLVSEISEKYRWLSNCYLDPSDPLTFHLQVDDNPETVENEANVDFFHFLDLVILPEFFLNSTDDTITYTSGGIKCAGLNETIKETVNWKSLETTPFGCGKFMLDYYNNHSPSVLTRSPFWFGVGAVDGTEERTPFVETVNIYDIPNKEERITKFKSGELDLIKTPTYPFESKNMQAEPRFEFQTEILNVKNLIAFNLEREFIGGSSNNIWVEGPDGKNYTEACAVRKAICYAIDREEMNHIIHDGEYTVDHNPIYLYTAFYYYDDVTKYYRNITAAWREFDSTRRYRVGINTPRTTHPSIIAVLCLILTSKIINRKKIRKERKKS